MGTPLKKLTIRGFKSIEKLQDFRLEKLNVLIGANGSGKSNFVEFFRMLRAMADEGFQRYVNEYGGDALLYLGPKVTSRISARLEFGQNIYEFRLTPTARNSLQVADETVQYARKGRAKTLSLGAMESALKARKDERSSMFPEAFGVPHYVYEAVSNWTVYHFHDTSLLAPMRRDHSVRDWERFRQDASNIAAFLLNLKGTKRGSYELIRDTVRLIAPFFDNFLLRPRKVGADEQIRLEWLQKGSDFPFQPFHLSDGTIRFVCLAIALLQPEPPATILIDEPELGLHPYAVSVLADLVKSAAERTQVIISTQSPTLLDYFEAPQVVIVNRDQGRSTFERLDAQELVEWLQSYSVGELWQKNVVRGGPVSE